MNERREARLKERCKILADVVRLVRPIYQDPFTTVDQKHFLETMIGAALWYLPTINECWTGKMSVEAILSFHPSKGPKPTLTADHEYPRKLAAADLLSGRLNPKNDLAKQIYTKSKHRTKVE